MSRIKCLIIDDEPHTASVLESYIGELEALEHAGTFYHAIDALMYLQQHKIDLLFLDIMLPKVTGDAFLKMLPCRPRVIFLSNKRKKWSSGGDDHLLGCLVKPAAFDDFAQLIDRYFAMVPAARRSLSRKQRKAPPTRGPFVYLFSGHSAIKVYLQEVLYIEGMRTYCKIQTTETEIIVYQGLTAIQTRLAGKGFIRIHRSLIVSVSKVTAFSENTIEICGHILPVSVPYRGKVERYIREELAQL